MNHQQGIARRLFIAGAYLLVSGLVLMAFAVYPGFNRHGPALFPDMIYGDAHRPYVCRILLPAVVRFIAQTTPEVIKGQAELLLRGSLIGQRFIRTFERENEYIYEYAIALALFFVCFFGLAVVLRHLIRECYDFPDFMADLAPAGALLTLPLFFRYSSYIYDPATLFLFSLGVLLILLRRHFFYYSVFVLATLNKETAILLCAVFLVREMRSMPKWRLALHLLLQGLVWLGIKAVLEVSFRANPGSPAEFHLLDHNLVLYSYPRAFFYFIAVGSAISVPVLYRWKEKPVFLRRGLLVTLAPLALLAFFFGYIDEIRVYYEAFPFLVLLSLPTVVRLFRIAPE